MKRSDIEEFIGAQADAPQLLKQSLTYSHTRSKSAWITLSIERAGDDIKAVVKWRKYKTGRRMLIRYTWTQDQYSVFMQTYPKDGESREVLISEVKLTRTNKVADAK